METQLPPSDTKSPEHIFEGFRARAEQGFYTVARVNGSWGLKSGNALDLSTGRAKDRAIIAQLISATQGLIGAAGVDKKLKKEFVVKLLHNLDLEHQFTALKNADTIKNLICSPELSRQIMQGCLRYWPSAQLVTLLSTPKIIEHLTDREDARKDFLKLWKDMPVCYQAEILAVNGNMVAMHKAGFRDQIISTLNEAYTPFKKAGSFAAVAHALGVKLSTLLDCTLAKSYHCRAALKTKRLFASAARAVSKRLELCSDRCPPDDLSLMRIKAILDGKKMTLDIVSQAQLYQFIYRLKTLDLSSRRVMLGALIDQVLDRQKHPEVQQEKPAVPMPAHRTREAAVASV